MTSPMHARKAKLRHHLVSAKAKLKHHLTLRRLLLTAAASAAALLLVLTLRTLSAASPRSRASSSSRGGECGDGKLPAAVAEALVHYATANATSGQGQKAEEVAVAARVLARRAPCNLLVFGLGHDSALWAALNHGGRTLFLEEDDARIAAAAARQPGITLDARRITTTVLADADELLALRDSPACAAATASPLKPDHFERSPCKLALRGLPSEFYEAEWNVVMVADVDAPTAWWTGAMYTGAVAARARRPGTGETDVVVVHGMEDGAISAALLCEGYLKEEIGRFRHFAIPSHTDKQGTPFCPPEKYNAS